MARRQEQVQSRVQSQSKSPSPVSTASPTVSADGHQPGAPVSPGESFRIEMLWKVIGRFDAYILSVNAKAALVATFNTFILAAIVLKWEDVLRQFGLYIATTRLAGVVLAIIAIAAVVSLWHTFRALGPFLASHKAPGRYHSALFFEHVAEHVAGADYHSVLDELTPSGLVIDLANQAHALASGTKAKFRAMRHALQTIAFVQLPMMGVLIVMKLVLAFLIA